MARTRSRPEPHIIWRDSNGKFHDEQDEEGSRRAYGDFRKYEAEGGGREALTEPGGGWATTNPTIAREIFKARRTELEEAHEGRLTEREPDRTTTLAELVRDHLVKKAKAGKTSDSHLFDLESRLGVAIKHFGAGRDPRTIEPEHVRKWSEKLADGGKRKPGTVRHYLNALSGLYGRAQEGLYVPPGYNPVAMLTEKPTGRWKGEAEFFEVADAALLLEAARILEERNRVNATPGLHAIVATFLLTGGRKGEVLGLDVEDVSFDRDLIRFRPNAHRGLKTSTSHRTVPIWPQLREILQRWIFGGDSPRTDGLLFPAPHGGRVRDLRKSLDSMGELCGFEEGEVRTRRFRHTYCSARLQTVQRIVKPGKDPATDPDPYEWVEVSRFTVQKEMGHGGAQLVDRIYGHLPRNPHRSEVVEYRVGQHMEELGERLAALAAVR